MSVVSVPSASWMVPIIAFLFDGILLSEAKEAKKKKKNTENFSSFLAM